MFEDIVNFLVQIFEAGKGSYDTFNSFADSSVVRGKGDNKFYGLGIALQNDFTDGYYIDASLRAGKSKMDYKSNDSGGLAEFKMNRNYMGAHLGFGKVTQIGENQELDVYLKGLYSRLDKKDVSIRGDKMSFDALNSFRTKLGARYLYELNDTAQIYSGVAYEREFDGTAKGYNHALKKKIVSPSMKGNSAMFELGTKFDITKNFNIDTNLQGYVGDKKGISGGAKVEYKF